MTLLRAALWFFSLSCPVVFSASRPSPENIERFAQWICAQPETEKKLKNDGTYEEEYKNGFPRLRGTCFNGKPDGEWTHWNNAGTKLSQGHFKNGKSDGEFLYYVGKDPLADRHEYLKREYTAGNINQDNIVRPEDMGLDENGKKHGYFVTSVDGKVRKRERFEHGQKIYEWLGGPALFQEGSFAKGKKTGVWTYWYPNEKMRRKGRYRDDKMEGTWRFYDRKGDLLFETSYVGGLKKGKATYFLAKGETLKGSYDDGKKVGTWIRRSKKGKIIEKRTFVKGKEKKSKAVAKGKSSPKTKRGIAQQTSPAKSSKKKITKKKASL